MRVLFIPAWFPTKKDPTAGVFIRKQAEAVSDLGIETGVIFFQNLLLDGLFSEKMGLFQSEKMRVSETRRLGIWPFPKPNPFFLNRWASLFDDLFERHVSVFGKPDLIHAEGLHAVFVAARLFEKHKIPFVFTEQSSAFRQNVVPSWLFLILKKNWEKAGKVIAVSPSLRDSMLEIWPEGEIEVVPNLFSDRDFPPELFWSKKRLPEVPIFLTVGALEPKKGHDLLIDAFEIFRKKTGQKARLVIVGDGPLKSFLNEKARKSGFSAAIELTGALVGETLRDRFLISDFFVLPSRHETFGVVVAEALASGLPVLATRCGGPEHFLEEKMGLLVPTENAEKLADGMIELLSKNEKWDRASISKTAHERFSSRVVGLRLIEIYHETLRERRIF